MAGIETPQLMERAYGIATPREYGTILVTPSRQAFGTFIVIDPSEKRKMLRRFHNYLVNGGANEYDLPQSMEYVAEPDFNQFLEGFRGKIGKTKSRPEGSYKLLTQGRKNIARENPNKRGYVGKNAISNVPMISSRDTRKRDISSARVTMTFGDLTQGTGIDFRTVTHDCEDFSFGTTKGAVILCKHAAGALNIAYDEQQNPKSEHILDHDQYEGRLSLPFNLDEETMMDVIFRNVMLGNSLKEIDRELLRNSDYFNPQVVDGINNGLVTFESIRQKDGKMMENTSDNSSNAQSLKKFKEYILPLMSRTGYERIGLYSVEFPDTDWETLCPTYLSPEGDIVRPVLNANFPPLIVIYTQSPEIDAFREFEPENPFEHINQDLEAVEDRSSRKSIKRIIVPGSNNEYKDVPQRFQQQYREFIREHFKGDTDKLLHELNLV